MNNTQLTLTQIFGALMRQKAKGLLAFLIVFGLVMALFLVWPKSYGSEGKLHVQMTRTETNLSPVVSSNGQGMGISIQDTRETEIKSVEEVLKSRAVLEAVVKKIGAKKILENSFSGLLPSLSVPSILKGGGSAAGDMSPEEYKELKNIELATNLLDESLSVHNTKKTSVISVYMKANSPRLAQEIVNEIISETRKVHQKMHGVTGSSAFFAEKVKEADAELEEALAKLEEFREKQQVLSVGSARFTLQEIIGTLEKGIMESGVEVEQSQRQIDTLMKEIGKTPEKIVLETKGVERKSGDDATVEVFRLESERQRLLSQYRATHPEVRKIDARLKQMKSRLGTMKDDRTQSQSTINAVFSDVKMQLVRAETQNIGAKARLKSLEKKLAKARKDAVEMNRAEIQADRLQRDVDDTRKDREMYVAKGREALASLSLDNSNLSTLVVAQQPTFILKHASPRGMLFLPIALILGTLAGLATAMFCERNHLSPSLNEVEVEQILEMPVLVTLPRVYSSRNMVN
ncbi:GumC family protein [Mariniblastus fucicola]|nr:hypothetical protein [Mariniblastus fucicola]